MSIAPAYSHSILSYVVALCFTAMDPLCSVCLLRPVSSGVVWVPVYYYYYRLTTFVLFRLGVSGNLHIPTLEVPASRPPAPLGAQVDPVEFHSRPVTSITTFSPGRGRDLCLAHPFAILFYRILSSDDHNPAVRVFPHEPGTSQHRVPESRFYHSLTAPSSQDCSIRIQFGFSLLSKA